MKKGICVLLIGSCLLQLTACAKTELEERCFPLLAVVDYEDDRNQVTFCAGFPRAENSGGSTGQSTELQVSTASDDTFETSKAKYEKNLNKTPDYNHLKVLVFGEDFVENEQAYNEMLDNLAATEEFPRNTYVCIVEDVDELLEIDKNLPQDLGTYLEEYLGNHEEKKNRMLTLGDLIDEKENKELVLYAPYLEPEETYVEWGGYYAISAGMPPVDFE